MLVKDAMTRTSIKFFENDYIDRAAKTLLESHMKGGLVYNVRDELAGCFTEHNLLEGLLNQHKVLSEIYQTDFCFLNEMDELNNIKLNDQEIWPILNKSRQITGFLTKEQYLAAYARTSQVELSRMDAIFNSAHNGILSIDLEGRITSMNPPAEKMAMTTKEKALGKFLTDVVTPSGLLNVIRTGKGHTEKYRVGKRKYLTHRTPLYDGKTLVGAVGVFQDISEIEFVSSELESVKQLLKEQETILDNSTDGICITDGEGAIIKCNQSFRQLFDVRNESPDYIKDIARQVEAKGRSHNIMETSKDNKNSLIITANPIKNSSNQIDRVVINVKDMTEFDALRSELAKTKSILEHMHLSERSETFIAKSPEMERLLETVQQVAKVDVTVLLSGESGVGKEEIAKLIQQSSPRSEGPFIKVNCGAIPESLMESELFGYEGGAFTGALKKGKAGLFEQADNGTIFLDEIGEIPNHLQVKLLRVLQEMEINRVGSSKTTKIDVRVIAATNRDLKELVVEGSFREDLFYRLNVIPIAIPPLRRRVEDIPILIDAYARMFAAKYHKHLKFTKKAIQVLTNYQWPGNVRELVNMIERIYVTASNPEVGEQEVLSLFSKGDNQGMSQDQAIVVNQLLPLKEAVDLLERELIYKASQSEKSYRGIARVLEVNPSTIVRKVKKLEGGLLKS
ncbi:sigma 54-interacting transcriptional regulator [Cytobacillus oceanisediminis]|uniref:sigma 54-interacting transcriptional regulator n=1 Tax=Cytobacillus TaxID=2675230 RepID=UPI001C2510DF|nr:MULTISPECIES: sigma 54-interacting transcriptional regulator [Cytobacillus]MBY0159381.1 sigma 54-interacting transcriptional regulator [Cytobacillus firmus]MBU8731680.1 sigma 54-interacting transcriptional regulator [Cytobacillus oceanisediminis]MCM3391542.1 sigma 54-interacting transcriptional regulator [Cytobacillus oceanisediminis]MCM3529043.1 sigma 54-interacting transcriptional regulator [Cytobacillus oceanisediminis]UQX53747.1 sigma 54-interacting transcriptional regulator [Cytobacill